LNQAGLLIEFPHEIASAGGQLAMALLRKLTANEKRTIGHWGMELVVVIAGVLIALGLQEWAQRKQALQNMNTAEDAIHDEVRAALTSLVWREAISKCHLERANLIKQGLTGASDRWPGLDESALTAQNPGGRFSAPLVIPSTYTRPADNFTTSAWTSALATGALAPMDRKRFGRLVAIYDHLQLLIRTREIEDRAAAKLSVLAFPMELTPEIRMELTSALYDIDRARFTFAAFGPQILADEMRGMGWSDKAEVNRWMIEDEADDRKNGLIWRPCVAAPRNPFK
jgi:hypothetical protein